MKPRSKPQKTLSCPSSRPEVDDSVIFGLVDWSEGKPQVGYLEKPLPTEKEYLDLSGEIAPTEIFRIASPCQQHQCQHFKDHKCALATRVTEQLDAVVDKLPKCRIRSTCLWWRQEGKAACLRCPQIYTDVYGPTEEQRQLAGT